MNRRPPRSTRTVTRFPYTTLCRSVAGHIARAARGGKTASVAIAIEQIEQVQAGDAHVAGNLRRRRSFRASDGFGCLRLLHAVMAVALIEHALHAAYLANGAQRPVLPGQPGNRCRVLLVANIIEQQAAPRIVGGPLPRGIPGRYPPGGR